MPPGAASVENIRDRAAVLAQVMNRIGVVPEEPEVGCTRAHGAEPSHGLVGIGLPCRIGILRDAPHSLDGGIGDQAFHGIHVGPLPRQWNGEHPDAVFLANREMPVVARHRAQKGDRPFFAPWSVAARNALQKREDDAVVHEREARVIAHEDLVDRRSERIGKQGSCLGEPLRPPAVVACILAAFGKVVAVAGQGQHAGAEVELFGGGLAARHVELEATPAKRLVIAERLIAQLAQLPRRAASEIGHSLPPSVLTLSHRTGHGLSRRR